MKNDLPGGFGVSRLTMLVGLGMLLICQNVVRYEYDAPPYLLEESSISVGELLADYGPPLAFVLCVALLAAAFAHGAAGLRSTARFLLRRGPHANPAGAAATLMTMSAAAQVAGVLLGLNWILAPFFRVEFHTWPQHSGMGVSLSEIVLGPMLGLAVGGVLLRPLACAASCADGRFEEGSRESRNDFVLIAASAFFLLLLLLITVPFTGR